jgi:hypothetical protein
MKIPWEIEVEHKRYRGLNYLWQLETSLAISWASLFGQTNSITYIYDHKGTIYS